jgi:hypothetical protein
MRISCRFENAAVAQAESTSIINAEREHRQQLLGGIFFRAR